MMDGSNKPDTPTSDNLQADIESGSLGLDDKPKWTISRIVVHVVLVVFAVIILFPLYWTFITSLRPQARIQTAGAELWPSEITFLNYQQVFADYLFPGVWNSIVAGVVSTIFAVILGTLAAYGLERFRFRGREDIAFFILSQRMMPPIAVAIPLLLFIRTLGLNDSVWSLIILYTVFNLPLALWIMRNFVRNVPVELEEAALIDGYRPFTVFLKFTLPLLRVGIATTAIFIFIFAWNEFLFALIMTTNGGAGTLPISLATLAGSPWGIEWGRLLALTMVAIVPVLILYGIVVAFLSRGIGLGGVRG
jgi:multiple sugar transport system permease protein